MRAKRWRPRPPCPYACWASLSSHWRCLCYFEQSDNLEVNLSSKTKDMGKGKISGCLFNWIKKGLKKASKTAQDLNWEELYCQVGKRSRERLKKFSQENTFHLHLPFLGRKWYGRSGSGRGRGRKAVGRLRKRPNWNRNSPYAVWEMLRLCS